MANLQTGIRYAEIPISEFCAETGLKRSSVIRAIRKLERMNIIKIRLGNHANAYCINEDYKSWKSFKKE